MVQMPGSGRRHKLPESMATNTCFHELTHVDCSVEPVALRSVVERLLHEHRCPKFSAHREGAR